MRELWRCRRPDDDSVEERGVDALRSESRQTVACCALIMEADAGDAALGEEDVGDADGRRLVCVEGCLDLRERRGGVVVHGL